MSTPLRSDPDAPSVFQTLSTPPEKGWPEGLLHHGARFLVFVLLAVIVTLLFPPVAGMELGRYEVGMVVDDGVIAEVPFGVPKTEEDLERERAAAAAAVPPTYEEVPDAAQVMRESLGRFFSAVDDAVEDPDTDRELAGVLADVGLAVTPEQRELLRASDSRDLLRAVALRAVDEVLPMGVMDDGEPADPQTTTRLQVRAEDEQRYVPRDSVLSSREFYDRSASFLPATASGDLHDLLRLVLIRHLEPSLRHNREVTERDRSAAMESVSTVRTNVLAGEAIVRANQQVSQSDLERLVAYEEELIAQGLLEPQARDFVPFVGNFLLNLLILGIFGLLLFFFRPEVYRDFRWVLLQAILVLAYAGAAAIIFRNDLPVELLPVAFVALALAVLWDGRIALFLTLVLAALTGVQPPFQGVEAWVPVLVGGSAAALSVRVVRRRAQTWVFIALIMIAYAGALLALGLIENADARTIAFSMSWAGMNTVVSAILAMGFLPVFEWFTRITTDQTLLEWADPNRRLLKRLALEAPGTYAHTINVANLCEAAATAIGANELLSRVGIYYHDVGKMLKPQYFIENQPGGRNPHDKLKPATSAAIVREHVTEGLRLAQEAKLPDVLAAFIVEHHGTQEISYFLGRARAEGGEEPANPELFRYPGPKPRSRETAIAMLADSVESATRSLQDPTRERIRHLIDELVDRKIRDGQLDDAPLTLGEITVIKDQFDKVLAGMYHHRIDYPETKHLTDAPGGEDVSEEGSVAAVEREGSGSGETEQEGADPEIERADEQSRDQAVPEGTIGRRNLPGGRG